MPSDLSEEQVWASRPERNTLGSSDNVLEAVGGVTGQPHALAATTQVLTVRPLHVNVPLLLLTGAASLRATLRRG